MTRCQNTTDEILLPRQSNSEHYMVVIGKDGVIRRIDRKSVESALKYTMKKNADFFKA